MPVPAPTSATRAPERGWPASSSMASKRAGGYEGRFSAYWAAAALKELARAAGEGDSRRWSYGHGCVGGCRVQVVFGETWGIGATWGAVSCGAGSCRTTGSRPPEEFRVPGEFRVPEDLAVTQASWLPQNPCLRLRRPGASSTGCGCGGTCASRVGSGPSRTPGGGGFRRGPPPGSGRSRRGGSRRNRWPGGRGGGLAVGVGALFEGLPGVAEGQGAADSEHHDDEEGDEAADVRDLDALVGEAEDQAGGGRGGEEPAAVPTRRAA